MVGRGMAGRRGGSGSVGAALPAAAAGGARATSGWTKLDLGLALALSLAAAAIRWPYLILIPRMTDEWEDLQFALRLAAEPFQLVSNDAYNGPLFHWLLAGLLAVTRSPLAPRLLVMGLGALTVGLSYALAASLSAWQRERRPAPAAEDRASRAAEGAASRAGAADSDFALAPADRLAGLLAAGLMAVSFVPVVVNSHIAWSNSTTPFWTTLLLLWLVEAVRRDRPRRLLVAGLLAGLAQQTHPSVLAILIGAAAWTVGLRPAWLRTRWPLLAALLALLALSNLLAYNLQSRGGSARMAEGRDYAYTGGASLAEYRGNLVRTGRLGYQMVGSAFLAGLSEETDPAALREVLLAPATLLYAAVALAGLGLGLAGGSGLPLACWLAALLILPFFNRGWHHFILARYLAGLLPPTFAAMGIALTRLAGSGGRSAGGDAVAAAADPSALPSGAPWRRARRLGALTIALLLVITPLLRLQRFYARELELGRHNRRVLQTLHALEDRASEGHPIALDRELRFVRLTAGGNLLNVLDGMLDLRALPHALVEAEDQAGLAVGSYVVLSSAQRDALAGVLELVASEPEPYFAPAAPGDYNLYRVEAGP